MAGVGAEYFCRDLVVLVHSEELLLLFLKVTGDIVLAYWTEKEKRIAGLCWILKSEHPSDTGYSFSRHSPFTLTCHEYYCQAFQQKLSAQTLGSLGGGISEAPLELELPRGLLAVSNCTHQISSIRHSVSEI